MKGLCNSPFLSALSLLVVLFLFGCGGNRQLQSISISPASVTAQGGQAQFTASGEFSNSSTMVMPVSVSWFQVGPAFDPPGQTIPFDRTTQPFTAQCFISGTTVTVVAYAPLKADAPANGTMPLKVFLDLVINRTMSEESGFVATTAQMTCP